MQRVRAKVCGITRVEDAQTAVKAGADAIGMILQADSPRCINLQKAQEIRAVVPPFVALVGVFVNAESSDVNKIGEQAELDLVQLHGEEDADYAKNIQRPYIRAIRARSRAQIRAEMHEHADARAFLLDPFVSGKHGGTGQTLDLDLWPHDAKQLMIIAGGLSSSNLPDVLAKIQPFAVDLNSGLEISPGVKSAQKIDAALQLVLQKEC